MKDEDEITNLKKKNKNSKKTIVSENKKQLMIDLTGDENLEIDTNKNNYNYKNTKPKINFTNVKDIK